MKSLIRLALLSLFLFAFVSNSYGQDNYASNVRTTDSDEKKLFINYDKVVNDGFRYFHVILELMHMGEPITPNPNNLIGDFGHAVTPGNRQRGEMKTNKS